MSDLRVVVANVGQADSNVLIAPNGNVAVIDCYDGGKIGRLLSDLGKTQIDLLVTTHPHHDHIKGVPHLIENFRICSWWDAKAPCSSKTYRRIHELCRERQIPATYIGGAGIFTDLGIPEFSIKVLAPSAVHRNQLNQEVAANDFKLPSGRSFNDYSIVLGVRYKSFNMVMGADGEMATWTGLHAEQPTEMRCQVLKLPHHGSMRGSHFQLLELMRPKHIIISYGTDNVHGHPAKLTLDALDEYKRVSGIAVNVWHTARDGSAVVVSNGSSRPMVDSLGDGIDDEVPTKNLT